MELRELLPERSAEDVLAGRTPVVLGGRTYVLRDLPRRANREFRERFQSTVGEILGGIGAFDDISSIVGFLTAQSDEQVLSLVVAFDTGNPERPGVLPSFDELDATATDMECLLALFAILAASFPLAVAALLTAGVAEPEPSPEPTTSTTTPPARMSSPRRRGAGVPTTLKTA